MRACFPATLEEGRRAGLCNLVLTAWRARRGRMGRAPAGSSPARRPRGAPAPAAVDLQRAVDARLEALQRELEERKQQVRKCTCAAYMLSLHACRNDRVGLRTNTNT